MEPHATRVVVWDTPSAIESGAPFRVKVGVKCAAECGAKPWLVEIRDDNGRALATARVGDVPWPDTALYAAEIELRAPESQGVHVFEVFVPAVLDETERGCTHAAASAGFQVRVEAKGECLLTVVAVDARSSAPVRGAKVVVHPYRAMTNALGVAEIRVPKGAYRLFVSGLDRLPFRSDGKITADVTVRAELDPDFGPSDAELWP